jgi:hypothetical protein
MIERENEKMDERRLAFGMGAHDRLGHGLAMKELHDELLKAICDAATPRVEPRAV